MHRALMRDLNKARNRAEKEMEEHLIYGPEGRVGPTHYYQRFRSPWTSGPDDNEFQAQYVPPEHQPVWDGVARDYNVPPPGYGWTTGSSGEKIAVPLFDIEYTKEKTVAVDRKTHDVHPAYDEIFEIINVAIANAAATLNEHVADFNKYQMDAVKSAFDRFVDVRRSFSGEEHAFATAKPEPLEEVLIVDGQAVLKSTGKVLGSVTNDPANSGA